MRRQVGSGLIAVVLACVPLLAGCGGADLPAMTTGTAAKADQASTAEAAKSSSTEAGVPDEAVAGSETGATAAEPTGTMPPAALATADITFDDLKFDIAKDAAFERSMLTKRIEDLAGRTIRIRGYILPTFQDKGLTQFVLVRDNQACCFGPGAALYDCIIVEMKPERSTDYSLYPVTVEGEFGIREVADPDGKTLAIFHLDGDSVR